METIMTRVLPDMRRGIVFTSSDGVKYDFRDATLTIDAINTPEGMIHAILSMPNEQFIRDILEKLIYGRNIPEFFSIYLEYGSYGVLLPSGIPMSQDHIRDVVYSILFNGTGRVCQMQVKCYSILESLPDSVKKIPTIADHLKDVREVEKIICGC